MTQTTEIDIDELRNKLLSKKAEFNKLGVQYVILGGSVALGNDSWWSDIDIFVSVGDLSDNDISADRVLSISRIIYSIIEYDDIDISIIEVLPIKIKFTVFDDGLLLYVKDKNQYFKDKADIINKYLDFKIWLDQHYKYQLEIK